MDADTGVLFLQTLGVKNPKVKNGWIVASCPLAQWLHKKGTDNSPSFGLRVNPGGRSSYSCFSCQSGSAEELLQTIELYTKDEVEKYDFALCRQLLEEEPKVLPLPEYGEFKQKKQEFIEWPQYWLDSFKGVSYSIDALDYLLKRGVEVGTYLKYDLRFDSKRQMIVAPYYDVFGRFAGARGRSILKDVEGALKHYDYSWEGKNNCRLVWYNEQVLQLQGSVVVVEGQFDCWRTLLAYPKVIANLTARPSWEKMKKLGDCSSLIQIPDNDATGVESTKVYASFCQKLEIEYKVLWLDEGVKDPDEACVDYLRERINGMVE